MPSTCATAIGIADGCDGAEATRRLLEEFDELVADEGDGTVFWLALAATQWEVGRIEEEVQRRALEAIDSGADLQCLEGLGLERGDLKRRRAVLGRLRVKLKSPQPAPVRVQPRRTQTTTLEPGDIFSYRLASGKMVLFRVLRLETDREGSYPVIALLDWIGDEPPEEPGRLGVRPGPQLEDEEPREAVYEVLQKKPGDFPADRIQIVARGQGPSSILWDNLDRMVEEGFGL